MRMNRSVAVATVLLAVPLLTPVAAQAATSGTQGPRAAANGTFTGYSSGTVTYVNAVEATGTTGVAQVGLAQSSSGAAVGTALPAVDQLRQPMLSVTPTGKSSYGHGASVNLGLLQSPALQPTLTATLAEATAPGTAQDGSDQLLSVPLAPVATADLLPGTATARAIAAGQCVTTAPISTGEAHAANADVLSTGGISVAHVGGSVVADSATQMVAKTNGTAGLSDSTVETIAPVTLFGGTPAALTITVLAPLRLISTVTGEPGGASITYAPVGLKDTDPVVTISGAGQSQSLTSQQLFGHGGVVLALGVADVTIGAPAHALDGLEGSAPTTSTDGTTAKAAADFIRITIPGVLPVPTTPPIDGPLAPLGSVITPVVTALAPALTALGGVFKTLGVTAADLRFGHLETSSEVPDGGIACAKTPPGDNTNPFSENYKDVSSISVAPGQEFAYTVRFPNRGSQVVTNVTVTDTYSTALQFISSTPAPTTHNGNVLTYKIGTLQPGQVAAINLKFKAPAGAADGTKYKNTAVISGTYAGRTVGGTVNVDGPTVTTPVAGACVLTYSSMYSSNKQVVPGENFTYYVDALNSGTKDCIDVKVVETLPTGVTFVSCQPACTVKDGIITWSIGTIKPGESKTVSVTVKTTATSGRLPGKATISASNGSPVKVSTNDPVVGTTSIGSPGKAAGCRSDCPAAPAPVVVPSKQLAFTGLDLWIPIAAMSLVLVGFAIRRRLNHSYDA